MTHQTLRRKLLKWLLVPLGVLWSLDAASTWARTRTTVNASFDRALHASALAIAERVTLEEGAPAVEIPPVALEVLDTEDQDRLFYGVSYRTGDAPARFLTGYADLPSPPAPAGGAPAFYEVPYRGELVRIAALQAVVASDPPVAVLVKVGETMVGRDRLVRSIATRELASKLVLVAVAALIVAFGVSRGLRPLLAVSRDAMQLLALARAERTAEAPPEDVVDACALARDACAKLVPQAVKAGLDVVFEGDDGALVQGRAWEVRELVENLVDNAIKYGRRETITVSVAPRAGAVVLAVEDEGPGIPADERPAALAPFGRLGGSSEHGAGLGLAIVGEIARGHGAGLRLLDARSGSGLRVEVAFPPAPPAGASPAA